jgi:hypothetical protein
MKFNEKYNHEDFLGFITGFLPEDFVEKEEDIVINSNRYKEITTAKILGFSKSLDVHVMEMDHGRENDPRIAIATDAFKILADHWIHKALVIFKNKESDNYRFSYLTISLDLNEKNKAVKKYSNARRYSFYLGTDAKIRTPEQQLLKKGKVKDVDDLLSRFSVEVVNKQFYLEVAKHFDELVKGDGENLMLPGVSQENLNIRKSFAVRLIGRLMFCWFLKQKKSESGQLIPDGLLSSKIVLDNYYHSILEPLFFGALNTSIDSRDIRSDLFDKVPYLNGGLFSPQVDDYYELDRGTFSSIHINTLKISDIWFKNFFELLETYNFTIDENTVFDQELSVDPEMLGRIFENLLAEINPETGSSERKRTGSFYTPRQIVEYMVDQSLLEYLKTKTKIEEKKLSALISYDLTDDLESPLDDSEKQEVINAIESLKILDPACGSGAYPIGALQKIVYILQQIDPDCKLWLDKKLYGVPELYKQKIINEVKSNPFNYTRKLDVIKNSIFGVDIQPIAVDVSRLRCFLTLVVESEVNDSKPNRGIEPLPNLDFKFVCANTLIGLPKNESGQASAFEDHSGIEELSGIMSEYFTANRSTKDSIKTRFFNKQKDLLNRMIEIRATGELTLKLTLWDPFNNSSNSWFDPEWMFGLEEKFDVVIGNPPYNVELTKEERGFYKNNYVGVSSGRQDTAAIFVEMAKRVASDKFNICFIIPYRLFSRKRNHGAFQEYVLSNLSVNEIIYLGKDAGFDSAKDEFMILLFSKYSEDNLVKICNKPDFKKLNDLDFSKVKQSVFEKNKEININISKYSPEVLNKIETGNLILSNVCEVKDGIVPYIREKMISKIKIDDRYVKFAGVSGTYKLDKYFFTAEEMYLCYDMSEARKYISDIEELRKVQLRDQSIFLQDEKIITSQNSATLKGAIDKDQYFVSNSIHSTYLKEEFKGRYKLTFILGCINSSLLNYYYNSKRLKGVDLHPQILITTLKLLPIPVITQERRQFANQIESLVDKVITLKQKVSGVDTDEFEHQIDELVMDLYGLDDKEKEIIRSS